MSTKIYNAYEYQGNIFQLNNILHKIRQKYFDYCCDKLDKYGNNTVKEFLEYYDRPDCYERQCLVRYEKIQDTKIKDLHHSSLRDALKLVIRKHSWDELNFEASAVVYPYKDKILIQFFGFSRDFKFSMRNFKDFHYQNQTDPPDDIPEKEFYKRGEIWDKILDRSLCHGVPANAGFTFRFIEEDNMFHFCWYYYHTFKGNEVK